LSELLPILGPPRWHFQHVDDQGGPAAADRSTSGLAFSARIVEAQESMRIQALRSEFAIEGFDEDIVGWLARA
jgi:hypothetical protein